MTVPTLEFFTTDWVAVPAESAVIQLQIVALPPVSANVGIVAFARLTPKAGETAPAWARIDIPVSIGKPKKAMKAEIDNMPNTSPGAIFQMDVRSGMDYVVRFQGQAHLLMIGFQDIKVGFVVSHTEDLRPLHDYGGPQTAADTRTAAINGDAFLRHA